MGGVGDVPEQDSVTLICDGDTVMIATSYTTSDCSDDGTPLPTNTFPTCLSFADILAQLGDLGDAFGGNLGRPHRLDDVNLDVLLGALLSGSTAFVCKAPAATVVTSFTLAGSVEDFGQNERAAIKAVLAAGAGVSPSAVSLTLSSGSVVVSAKILFKETVGGRRRGGGSRSRAQTASLPMRRNSNRLSSNSSRKRRSA